VTDKQPPDDQFLRLLQNLAEQVSKTERSIREVERIRDQMQTLLVETQPSGIRLQAVRPNEKNEGIKHLREFTRDVVHVTVIDPYIYWRQEAAELSNYVEAFAQSICLDTNTRLDSIQIIYYKNKRDQQCRTAIVERIKSAGKDFSDRQTKVIHDRVWIMDDTRAIVTGTSLNGIGCKLAFILELPDEDLQVLKKFLQDQGLTKA
jgi:hypothetical protein